MIRSHIITILILLLTAGNVISAEPLLNNEISLLNFQSNKYAKYLNNRKLLYDDKDVIDYLQTIMHKLFPEYPEVFHIHIYNSSEINASATFNGHIYIKLGMLAKANNEAQIASVLAHEGAHIIKNHALKGARDRKWIVSGADFFGRDRTLTYLSDYSVDAEQEADDEGFDRLLSANYDPNEAVKLFQHMANEVMIRSQKEPSLYNSHPKLLDRIAYLKSLSKGYSGFVGEELYLEKMSAIKLICLQRNITNYRYNSVLLDLENNSSLSKLLPQSWYYLGEAYRQRATNNDDTNSENAYLKAIELTPSFAPSYRALGVLYMKRQQHQKALSYFDKYLAMSPHAQDRLYVADYYDAIKNGGETQ